MFTKTIIAVVLVHSWDTAMLFCEQSLVYTARVNVLNLTEKWEHV
jgi:hypothetical protein